MGGPKDTSPNPDELLERRDGLAHFIASGVVGFVEGHRVQSAHLKRNLVFGSQLLPSKRCYLPQK